MSKLKPRRILVVLGAIVLIICSYVGWQVYQGQQMVNQYAAEAQKLAQSPGTQVPSPPESTGTPSSLSGTPSSGEYKQLMTKTYQQTLQTMQTVKENTLALRNKNLSISAYRSSILESQATFTSAEEFVRANPPTEEKLNTSYQEFLAGISLAKESMGVVLKGISPLSPSNFYAAREMGKQALQQVVEAYAHF